MWIHISILRKCKVKIIGNIIILMMLFVGDFSQAAVVWLGNIETPAYSYEGYMTKPHSKRVLSVIEQMPWIEERAKNESHKYVYIFYFPECPASQELYEESREFIDEINIRWIPLVHERYAGLFETRTPKALRDAFEKDIAPKIQNQKLAEKNLNLTVTTFRFLLTMGLISSDRKGHFPTVVYGNSDRIDILINPYFEDIVELIPNTHSTQEPYILELAAMEAPNINAVSKGTMYQTKKETSVEVYLTADENSLLLGVITGELGPFEVVGTTKGGLIVVDLSGDGDYIYFKDENPTLILSR